ncbi:MAG TPA: 5,10-methylenetetrahydrofolate reductase [Syntrophobacteraceae bacterium]|nr:5,10-methylenetetrahydrofolate reductase [Syntrophobacteraceae bacterium]HBD09525.1 5,10-methylenetetrahydrofolate reductase [Syntrophobacteraceae bacterium]HBZ55329.1 5,10-methylenetetrahydrofolate reductase [Syntrophobacteraceae bacterium]
MAGSFRNALQSGQFVVTAEVGPPKGTDIEEMKEHIALLKDKVHGINMTDNQSSVMRLSSLVGCHIIKQMGGEPILQMTGRDRNRMALQSDLLSASVLGIENVLCLTGDHIIMGDHKDAKPVHDLESVQILRAARTLESGQDLGGNPLKGAPKFCVGAVVTPEADPIEPQLLKFEKKIRAGAEFFQTQAVYDLDNFKRFMDYAGKFDVKILAGIVLLVSAKMATYMNEFVAGIQVPQKLVDEMASAPKGGALQRGIEIAGRMVRQIKEQGLCHGVHIMAIGKETSVPAILSEAGL